MGGSRSGSPHVPTPHRAASCDLTTARFLLERAPLLSQQNAGSGDFEEMDIEVHLHMLVFSLIPVSD